ncbi:MAG: DUF4405 domain-containing protein [Anaerohalosphaera sp.]|nr:DUF4405 domain-containing protein [Anaerohalosphaera sp.]
MEKTAKKIFQFRAFVSLLTSFSFIVLLATGAILFITPPGRIANWTGWTLAGFTKHQWVAIHIWFGAVFAVASILHIYLNIKAIVNYLSITASKTYRFRFEWVAALLLCGLVFAGTHYKIKPFSSLLAFQDSVKLGWQDNSASAPVPHAELWTLEELANNSSVPLDTIMANLKTEGISTNSVQSTLEQISEQTVYTPDQIYAIALGRKAQGCSESVTAAFGTGFGQKTLKQVCQQASMDLQETIENLKKNNITASGDMTIRAIADAHNIHPSQIKKMIEP